MNIKNKTILIIDDEEDICSTLSKILTAQGYKTLTSLDATNGLNQIKKNFKKALLSILRKENN